MSSDFALLKYFECFSHDKYIFTLMEYVDKTMNDFIQEYRYSIPESVHLS